VRLTPLRCRGASTQRHADEFVGCSQTPHNHEPADVDPDADCLATSSSGLPRAPRREEATHDNTSAVIHRRTRNIESNMIMQVACHIGVTLPKLT
jgi:hypothetical protein